MIVYSTHNIVSFGIQRKRVCQLQTHSTVRQVQMGLKLKIIVLLVTIVVTASTTALMCFCVVTDHWEIVSYRLSNIEKILNVNITKDLYDEKEHPVRRSNNANEVSVESLYKEKVILIKDKKETKQIMIQMHAGLWSICYDVAGMYLFLKRSH